MRNETLFNGLTRQHASQRRRTVAIAALAVAAWLTLAPAAGGHEADHGGAVPPAVAAGTVDGGESAALGFEHAREHARARVLERQASARWAALTAQQRQQRLRAAARQTAISSALPDNPRDDKGFWEPALNDLPEHAIHASVLPTGDVLYFAFGTPHVFDTDTGTSEPVPLPGIDAGTLVYCSGQALLSDGRVLIAGGTIRPTPGNPEGDTHPRGLQFTFIFDPWAETDQWERGPSMQRGRWYPTLVKLSSGDIVIVSGYDHDGRGLVNPQMDIYRPGTDVAPTPLVPFPAGERGPGVGGAVAALSLYPGLFLLPNANVAMAGPGQQDSALLDTTVVRDPTAEVGSAWSQILPTPAGAHYGGSPVLEPLLGDVAGSWNVLLTGGVNSVPVPGLSPAKTAADRLSAGPGTPVWTAPDPRDDLQESRYYPNNVLLPDGGMVMVGGGAGADHREDIPNPAGNWWLGDTPREERKQVELRRPGERTWRLGEAQQEWRTYHSTAALLPDGRVMSAGDEVHEGPDGAPEPPERVDSAEIYWPPYLFNADLCAPRPEIRGVGTPNAPAVGARQWATLTYGEQVGIFSEHAGRAMRAALVAPAAVTHSVDMNQRVVPLAVNNRVPGGGLNVTMPATAAIAPPGYYMLFIIGEDGTPSKAAWVHVLAPAAAAADPDRVTPVPVDGVWPDPVGRQCLDTDGTTTRTETYTLPPADSPPPLPNPGGSVIPAPAPSGAAPDPVPGATPSPAKPPKGPAKLGLTRAAVQRATRQLDVLAPISALASGSVDLELFAAGARTRMSSPIDASKRRIRVLRRIPVAQARRGTGILTMNYNGNDVTLPQTVRLRAAARPAKLVARRPSLSTGGRLRASGTISPLARGVVRAQLQLETVAGTRTLEFRTPIQRGRWQLDTQLSGAARDAIGKRTATVHAYVLFTGYEAAGMRGEMRSYRVLGAR